MGGQRSLVLGSGSGRTLVLLPGFMIPARAYRDLIAPLVHGDPDLCVRVPQLYRLGVAALRGQHTVQEEARAAADLVAALPAPGRGLWLAGHSRGGQAAWLAAGALAASGRALAGLILIDPVDGVGPRSGPTTTTRPAGFSVVPLIVGAGIGGQCAPSALNHHQFAAAAPDHIHVVVRELGHADVLSGRARHVGRRLCGGGAEPDAARATVTALMSAHMNGALEMPGGPWPSPVDWT